MAHFRSFSAADLDSIWGLHNEALEDAGAHGGHGPWEADLRDIEGVYVLSGGAFLVADLEGSVVAMGGVVPRDGGAVAEIRRMRVAPAHQRRGIGRGLLAELERHAGAHGARRITLDTTEEQLAAQHLYESAGYAETGRRTMGRFTVIDYEKTLT